MMMIYPRAWVSEEVLCGQGGSVFHVMVDGKAYWMRLSRTDAQQECDRINAYSWDGPMSIESAIAIAVRKGE
jgi:hypothetical protein